jgi:hypothetical protein
MKKSTPEMVVDFFEFNSQTYFLFSLFRYNRASSTHSTTVLFASQLKSCFAFSGLARDTATSQGLLATIS